MGNVASAPDGRSLPKQFLPIAGRPMILRALDPFLEACNQLHVAVVIHPHWLSYWLDFWEQEKGCLAEGQTLSSVLAGETRTASVWAGLNRLFVAYPNTTQFGKSIIAIHDAARPMVTSSHISALLAAANTHGSAIPVVPVVDSIRELSSDESSSKPMDRSSLCAVQTPQCFDINELFSANVRLQILCSQAPSHIAIKSDYTDDATLYEAFAEKDARPIYLAKGAPANFKVTTAADFARAEALLR
jgi:2-C-methyl-D-erythritol 4-phosphate cytidylyltransferase